MRFEGLLKSRMEEDPDISLLDEYETLHRVWRIQDPSLIQAVQQKMRDKKTADCRWASPI